MEVNEHNIWKIDRDPYYSELYDKFGYEFIKDAGFFEDSDKIRRNLSDTLNVLCTPITNAKEILSESKSSVILLFTGSFNHTHSGHLETVHNAKKAAYLMGYDGIVVTYMSPGHDEYVSSKKGNLAIPVWERIRHLTEQIKQHSNLYDLDNVFVDPWEGAFNKVAVNFTDVIQRLSMYVEKWTGKKIPVVYVCGGDNVKFVQTFLLRGQCIVVGRPGYDEFDRYRQLLKNEPRIFFMEGNNANSSTSVLKVISDNDELKLDKKRLFLRKNRIGTNETEDKISSLLTEYFSSISYQIIEQQEKIVSCMSSNTINLDDVFRHKFHNNLQISRCYDIGGHSKIKNSPYINRPGSLSFTDQISVIDKRLEYCLFDDDIHSGETMKVSRSMLESNGIKIIDQLSFVSSMETWSKNEILDVRDFTLEPNCGLVVKLPDGTTTRVPYMYPYVDPYVRGSIQDPLKFSMDAWKILIGQFQLQRLKDYPHMKIFKTIGFSDKDYMDDICNWHFQLLRSFL